jgi:hypothetical protein
MRIAMTAAMIAVGLTCAAGQASAADAALAQVSSVKGAVAVNQGGRIVPLTSATLLNAGDRLVSIDGGQARIKFADGCVIDVRSSAVATLGAKSPCAGSGLVKSSSPMQFDEPAWTAALGVLTVAALTWLVFEASDDGNSPLSP